MDKKIKNKDVPLATTCGHRCVAVANPRSEHLPGSVGGALLSKDKGSEDGRNGGMQEGRQWGRKELRNEGRKEEELLSLSSALAHEYCNTFTVYSTRSLKFTKFA